MTAPGAVIATAGHVDHGKSTLVRLLTGTDPDRWPEEQRRGLTLDLGYAATVLPSGRRLSLVDVPGHGRYVGNALAGLVPVRAVLLCVAADRGWQPQTTEHADAIAALGVEHVVLAATRSDLADPDPVLADATARLGGVTHVEAVATTPDAAGADGLALALDRCLDRVPVPAADAPLRLWVDRAFAVRGRGTVVTATLEAGTVRDGDVLTCAGQEVRVRGLQVHGVDVDAAIGPTRVAIAVRSEAALARGSALADPQRWAGTGSVDVALTAPLTARPGTLVLHVGTAALPVRVRPLGDRHARLVLPHPLPLRVGDRALLRRPDRHAVAAGVRVLDVAPPPLTRRGAAVARAAALSDCSPLALALGGGPRRVADLVRAGVLPDPAGLPAGVAGYDGWAVLEDSLPQRAADLVAALDALPPTSPGLPAAVAAQRTGVPLALVPVVAAVAGTEVRAGVVPNPRHGLPAGAEAGVRRLERLLATRPWSPPDRGGLRELGLDATALATAAAAGRLLRLGPDLALLPDAPARAMAVLRTVAQPFTVGEAARALGSTRRVVVPLLEHLDGLGATRRDGPVRQTADDVRGWKTTTSSRES